MRHIIISTILFAGACDMPEDTSNNNLQDNPAPMETEGIESEGTSLDDDPIEDFQAPLLPPPPAVPFTFGQMIPCSQMPDRTAAAERYDLEVTMCHILESGLTWATINQPGYQDSLQAIADAHKEEWGVRPDTDILAFYTFSDLTPDP